MDSRATRIIRIALLGIAAAGIALYIWGIADFGRTSDTLFNTGFSNPAASNWSGAHPVVAPAYRQFPSIDIANAASIVAALALIFALSWQGGITFRLPRRLALIIGLPLSFVWFAHSLQPNGDITSLDHLATGLLRFDEDSWGEPIAVLLMVPGLLITWPLAFLDYDASRAPHLRRINLLLLLPTLAAIWFGGTTLVAAMTSEARYDSTSPHSFIGLGPFLFYIWLSACLIAGRAAAFSHGKHTPK